MTIMRMILESLLEEQSEIINWDKAMPLTRYTEEAPPIILDNIEEINATNVCTSEIKLSVLTSYYDSTLCVVS